MLLAAVELEVPSLLHFHSLQLDGQCWSFYGLMLRDSFIFLALVCFFPSSHVDTAVFPFVHYKRWPDLVRAEPEASTPPQIHFFINKRHSSPSSPRGKAQPRS